MSYFWKYIRYLFRSKHRRGFGIHSPFLYYFVTMVTEETYPYYRFSQIENLRKILNNAPKLIADQGGKDRKISTYIKEETFSPSYDQLLFRWTQYFKPQTVLEVGESVGITTLYLSASDSKRTTRSVGSDQSVADLANMNFSKVGLANIQALGGEFSCALEKSIVDLGKIDFLYVGRMATPEMVDQTIRKVWDGLTQHAVVVLSDIYRTPEREAMWLRLKREGKVRVSVELFHYGILFFDENLQKEEYNLFYMPPFFKG